MHLSLVILASEREEFFLLGKLLSCSLTFYPFSSRLSSEWRSLGKLAPLLLSQRFPLSSPYIHLDADILPRGFFSPLNVHPFRPRAGEQVLSSSSSSSLTSSLSVRRGHDYRCSHSVPFPFSRTSSSAALVDFRPRASPFCVPALPASRLSPPSLPRFFLLSIPLSIRAVSFFKVSHLPRQSHFLPDFANPSVSKNRGFEFPRIVFPPLSNDLVLSYCSLSLSLSFRGIYFLLESSHFGIFSYFFFLSLSVSFRSNWSIFIPPSLFDLATDSPPLQRAFKSRSSRKRRREVKRER